MTHVRLLHTRVSPNQAKLGILVLATILAPLVLAAAHSLTLQRVIIGFSSTPDQHLLQEYRVSGISEPRSLHVVAGEIQDGLLPWLQAEDAVEYVEIDREAHAVGDLVDWGLSWIKGEQAWATSTGASVKVAVLDTGINPAHPDLAANVKGCISFVGSDPNDCLDRAGHGTGVAGIIAASKNDIGALGVAYDVDVYAVKVLGDDGTGYYSDIIEGILWASSQGIPVISMSLGGSWDSLALADAVRKAYSAGSLLVAAAGNSGPSEDTVLYPARYPEVVAVGALDYRSYNIASFSSRGLEVELAAPGVSIYTTGYDGMYTYFSGTSAAAPLVSGVAALVKAASPTFTNVMIREAMTSTAVDLGYAGRDTAYGYGMVDALKAVEWTVPSAAAAPDVAVKSITLPAKVVKGTALGMAVEVANEGEAQAEVSLLAYDETDASLLGSEKVTLDAGAWQKVGFSFDTSSMVIGGHSIEVEAQPLAGETDVADNTMMGVVEVVAPVVVDVAVKSISLPGQVTKGSTLEVGVVVVNEGSQMATLTLSVRDETDGVSLGSRTLTVDSGASQIVDVGADTGSMTVGVHSIGALVEPLPGESDVADNSRSATVQVVLPLQASPTLVVAASTDSSVYLRRSRMALTVSVWDGEGVCVGGATVKITIRKPNGAVYYVKTDVTDAQGRFVMYLYIQRYAMKGSYTVLVEASKSGYVKGQATTTFAVT